MVNPKHHMEITGTQTNTSVGTSQLRIVQPFADPNTNRAIVNSSAPLTVNGSGNAENITALNPSGGPVNVTLSGNGGQDTVNINKPFTPIGADAQFYPGLSQQVRPDGSRTVVADNGTTVRLLNDPEGNDTVKVISDLAVTSAESILAKSGLTLTSSGVRIEARNRTGADLSFTDANGQVQKFSINAKGIITSQGSFLERTLQPLQIRTA